MLDVWNPLWKWSFPSCSLVFGKDSDTERCRRTWFSGTGPLSSWPSHWMCQLQRSLSSFLYPKIQKIFNVLCVCQSDSSRGFPKMYFFMFKKHKTLPRKIFYTHNHNFIWMKLNNIKTCCMVTSRKKVIV